MSRCAVIGGGPIGLYTALELARRGHEVFLFEKKTWPIDKVCGQGIMPSGVKLLRSIGVDLAREREAFRLQGIEYIDGALRARGDLLKESYAIERRALSQKLFACASNHPLITLYHHHQLERLAYSRDQVALTFRHEEKISQQSFDYAFACDGLHSKVREQLGFIKTRRGPWRLGARFHVAMAPWNSRVEVHWSQGVEAYVTPLGDQQVEIAFLWYQNRISSGGQLRERLLELFPDLARRLAPHPLKDDFKAYGPFQRVANHFRAGPVFLLGDAYQFLDGITGEGISLGLKSARLILSEFEKPSWSLGLKIRLMYGHYRALTEVALLFSRWPRGRRWVLKFLQKWPHLMHKILAFNDLELASPSSR